MAKEAKQTQERETRIDEFAVGVFGSMGYSGRLPDQLVNAYIEFQKRKSVLQPGRLSSEGFAMVSMLADLATGTVELDGSKKADAPKE